MNELKDLDRRMMEKLTAAEDRWRFKQNHLHERMREFEERHQRYAGLVDRLVQTIVKPRIDKLANTFANAKYAEQVSPHRTELCFNHTARFPATVRLEMGISHDGTYEHLLGEYHLEILPIFFPFKASDQVAQPIDAVDEGKLAAWFDDHVLEFLDTYLRLDDTDQYQSENLVADPVCGMHVNKAYAPGRAEHQGKMHYFCTNDCRRKFLEDPGRYLGVPSRE
jgi:YHS domain-containing protein